MDYYKIKLLASHLKSSGLEQYSDQVLEILKRSKYFSQKDIPEDMLFDEDYFWQSNDSKKRDINSKSFQPDSRQTTILKARKKQGYKILEKKIRDANIEIERARANTARSGRKITNRDIFNYLLENGTDPTEELNLVRESQGKVPFEESKVLEWIASRRRSSVISRDPQRATRYRLEPALKKAKKIMLENPNVSIRELYKLVDLKDVSIGSFSRHLKYSHSDQDPFGQYLQLFRSSRPNMSIKNITSELIPVLNNPKLFSDSLANAERYPALSSVSSVEDLNIRYLNSPSFSLEVSHTYGRMQGGRGTESHEHATMLEAILTRGIANTSMSMGSLGPELIRGPGESIRASVPGMNVTFKDIWEDPRYTVKYIGEKLVEFFEINMNKKVSYQTLFRWMQREGLLEKRREALRDEVVDKGFREYCTSFVPPVNAIVCKETEVNGELASANTVKGHTKNIIKIIQSELNIKCKPTESAKAARTCKMHKKYENLSSYLDVELDYVYNDLAGLINNERSSIIINKIKEYFRSFEVEQDSTEVEDVSLDTELEDNHDQEQL